MNNMYLVVINNSGEIYNELFDCFEKAKNYFDSAVENFKEDNCFGDIIEDEENYFCTYDDGEYNDWHWEIGIISLEAN